MSRKNEYCIVFFRESSCEQWGKSEHCSTASVCRVIGDSCVRSEIGKVLVY